MDSSNPLLLVSKEEVERVRRSVGLTDEADIERDVDMVLEWYHKQQHLPRIQLDRKFVERVLVSRKGSVEQTKQKIDLMFTLRNRIPELAAPRDILHPLLQNTFKAVSFGILPKLNHDQTRVHVFKIHSDVDNFDLADIVKYVLMTIEYRYLHDYCSGDRYICDYSELRFAHITKFNPITIKNAEIFVQQGYGIRIKGIHYINAPSFINKILVIMRSALSEKLAQRLLVHENIQDLQKHVDKECLPADYGGSGPAIAEITDAMHQEFKREEVRQYLINQESLRTDETLRIGDNPDDDALGLPGSFKKLNVD